LDDLQIEILEDDYESKRYIYLTLKDQQELIIDVQNMIVINIKPLF